MNKTFLLIFGYLFNPVIPIIIIFLTALVLAAFVIVEVVPEREKVDYSNTDLSKCVVVDKIDDTFYKVECK